MEVVDKHWLYEQYDSMVQTNTVKGPGTTDASVIRVKETGKAIAMSSDCNPRYCYIDPKGGAAAAVMESGRNVAMSGAIPLAITDCLNYGNPEKPETMWQFAQGCEGIKEACKNLNTPVVSGNVSLYNETEGVGVFPTPTIAMVGVNASQKRILPSALQEEGSRLYLLGETGHHFGGSLYMKTLYGKVAGKLAPLDFEKERALWDFVIAANEKGLLRAAKDVSVGGLAITLAKMAATGGKGVTASLTMEDGRDIFSESFSRAIVETEDSDAFETFARAHAVAYTELGRVGGSRFVCNDVTVDMNHLKERFYNRFEEVITQDL
jgi:phosphoribosylformylglycinamidine (FGAM) synthase-like enzyme